MIFFIKLLKLSCKYNVSTFQLLTINFIIFNF